MTRPGLSKWANLFAEEMWKRGWDLVEIGPDGIWMQHGRGGELVDFSARRQSGIAIVSRGLLVQQYGETVREAADQMLNTYPDCDYVFGDESGFDDMHMRIEDVFFAARELRGLQSGEGANPETSEPWSDFFRWGDRAADAAESAEDATTAAPLDDDPTLGDVEDARHAPVCKRVRIHSPPTDPTPTYYRAPRGTLTAADVIDAWGLDYWAGSVVAHVLRAGRKPGETKLDALRNAAGCLAHAIRVEEGGE